MHHAKRRRLTVEDFNKAMKWSSVEVRTWASLHKPYPHSWALSSWECLALSPGSLLPWVLRSEPGNEAKCTHMHTHMIRAYVSQSTFVLTIQPLYGYSTSQPPDFQSIHESGLFSLHDHDVRVMDTALATPPDPHTLPTPPSVQGSSGHYKFNTSVT